MSLTEREVFPPEVGEFIKEKDGEGAFLYVCEKSIPESSSPTSSVSFFGSDQSSLQIQVLSGNSFRKGKCFTVLPVMLNSAHAPAGTLRVPASRDA